VASLVKRQGSPWAWRKPCSLSHGKRHAVDGLLNDCDVGAVVFAFLESAARGETVAGGSRAVHDFAFEQFALEVGGHEVPPMHLELEASGDGCQRAQGAWPEGGTKGLVVVDPGDLCAALYAQSSLQLARALDLVDPDEFDQAAASRHLVPGHYPPRCVAFVVVDLEPFSFGPSDWILGERFGSITRVDGYGGRRRKISLPGDVVAHGAEACEHGGVVGSGTSIALRIVTCTAHVGDLLAGRTHW
jgi:hypothetical protein